MLKISLCCIYISLLIFENAQALHYKQRNQSSKLQDSEQDVTDEQEQQEIKQQQTQEYSDDSQLQTPKKSSTPKSKPKSQQKQEKVSQIQLDFNKQVPIVNANFYQNCKDAASVKREELQKLIDIADKDLQKLVDQQTENHLSENTPDKLQSSCKGDIQNNQVSITSISSDQDLSNFYSNIPQCKQDIQSIEQIDSGNLTDPHNKIKFLYSQLATDFSGQGNILKVEPDADVLKKFIDTDSSKIDSEIQQKSNQNVELSRNDYENFLKGKASENHQGQIEVQDPLKIARSKLTQDVIGKAYKSVFGELPQDVQRQLQENEKSKAGFIPKAIIPKIRQ